MVGPIMVGPLLRRISSSHEQAQQRERLFCLRPCLEADPSPSLTHSSLRVCSCITMEPYEGLPLASKLPLKKLKKKNHKGRDTPTSLTELKLES